jgi:hypothetical protein
MVSYIWRFNMYGAGSISTGGHKFLPYLKSSPNLLIFCIRGFFDMRNSNLKEFSDFDRWKLPLQGVYPLHKLFKVAESNGITRL